VNGQACDFYVTMNDSVAVTSTARDQTYSSVELAQYIRMTCGLPAKFQPAANDNFPVDLWAEREKPSLPVGVVPTFIEEFARSQAEMIGADPGGIAMAALTVCAGAIPDAIKFQVKRHDSDWLESPRLWTALVGNPSTPEVTHHKRRKPAVAGDRRWASEELPHGNLGLCQPQRRRPTPCDAPTTASRNLEGHDNRSRPGGSQGQSAGAPSTSR
jgi:hypothetical protein